MYNIYDDGDVRFLSRMLEGILQEKTDIFHEVV